MFATFNTKRASFLQTNAQQKLTRPTSPFKMKKIVFVATNPFCYRIYKCLKIERNNSLIFFNIPFYITFLTYFTYDSSAYKYLSKIKYTLCYTRASCFIRYTYKLYEICLWTVTWYYYAAVDRKMCFKPSFYSLTRHVQSLKKRKNLINLNKWTKTMNLWFIEIVSIFLQNQRATCSSSC